jgi:fumarate hydratase class II
VQAADEVLDGQWDDQFPLVVWQTGSGTQSNMNMNEVLANRANELTISIAGASGNFELNVYMPVIALNLLQMIRLLGDACNSLRDHCVIGITANVDHIEQYVNDSLMLVTALNPHIGYENAATVAKHAHHTGQTLKASAVELGMLTAAEFDAWVSPQDMIGPKAKM